MTRYKLADKDIDHIKKFEGLSLKACKAVSTEKYWTIGYGHYGSDVTRGMTITEAQAKQLLARDLVKFEAGINELDVCQSQEQYLALVDFAYNCGIAALKKSTLLKYIRHNATDLMIAREFMAWVRSGGVVLKGLVNRRKWEAETYTGREIYRDEKTQKWMLKKNIADSRGLAL